MRALLADRGGAAAACATGAAGAPSSIVPITAEVDAGPRAIRSFSMRIEAAGSSITSASTTHQTACRVAAFTRGPNFKTSQTNAAIAKACHKLFSTAAIQEVIFPPWQSTRGYDVIPWRSGPHL